MEIVSLKSTRPRTTSITPTSKDWEWAYSEVATSLCKQAVAQAIRKGATKTLGIDTADLMQEARIYAAAKRPLITKHLNNGRKDLAISCIRCRLYTVSKIYRPGGIWELAILTQEPTR